MSNYSWAELAPPGAVTEPSQALKDSGYGLRDRPAYDHWNWLLRELMRGSFPQFATGREFIESGADQGIVLPYIPVGTAWAVNITSLKTDPTAALGTLCPDGEYLWAGIEHQPGHVSADGAIFKIDRDTGVIAASQTQITDRELLDSGAVSSCGKYVWGVFRKDGGPPDQAYLTVFDRALLPLAEVLITTTKAKFLAANGNVCAVVYEGPAGGDDVNTFAFDGASTITPRAGFTGHETTLNGIIWAGPNLFAYGEPNTSSTLTDYTLYGWSQASSLLSSIGAFAITLNAAGATPAEIISATASRDGSILIATADTTAYYAIAGTAFGMALELINVETEESDPLEQLSGAGPFNVLTDKLSSGGNAHTGIIPRGKLRPTSYPTSVNPTIVRADEQGTFWASNLATGQIRRLPVYPSLPMLVYRNDPDDPAKAPKNAYTRGAI